MLSTLTECAHCPPIPSHPMNHISSASAPSFPQALTHSQPLDERPSLRAWRTVHVVPGSDEPSSLLAHTCSIAVHPSPIIIAIS